MLENFFVMFYEFYYKNYIIDNLEECLEKVGFVNIVIEVYFVSKYWVVYKFDINIDS